jgi:hypothetical protein
MFSSAQRPDRLWDPPLLLSNAYWGGGSVSSGVKLSQREPDHSLPYSVVVMTGGAIPQFPSASSWHGA